MHPVLSSAVVCARIAHLHQMRCDGRPYVEHPLEVLAVLMGISSRLPVSVYAAAILHDVLEDTDKTYAELRVAFGLEVADMVLALTKPAGRCDAKYDDKIDRYLQTLSDASRYLPGVMFIKLADQIHNIETVHFLPPARRDKVLAESQTHYLPFFMQFSPAPAYEEMYGKLFARFRSLVTT